VGDDADVLVFRFEYRSLLDVIFEIGVHLARADLFVADPADAGQFLAEALALLVLAAIGVVLAVDAGEDAGGEHGGGEAGAFFVRPVGDDDRMSRLDAEIVHRAHDLKAGEHAEHAVIFATGRLGVEMRADIDGQRIRVGAGARHEHVAHRVDAHREARIVAPGLEQAAALRIGVGQRLAVVAAGNAGADLRHLHKTVPQAVAVDAHVLAGCGHVESSHSRRAFAALILFPPVRWGAVLFLSRLPISSCVCPATG
jgi:hypothetical protein